MPKKVAIVLGAHRSGTSLLTAGLESLGAYLGIKTNYKSEENPKGFFENEEIVHFNDRLLEYLGGRWDNPLFDGRQALADRKASDLAQWYKEAKEIFLANFEEKDFIAIKDPRICQLLPFWTKVLSQNGYRKNNIYYVHISRHPLEVAQSQYKRKQQKPEFYFLGENPMETISLWMSLSYQSLRDLNSDQNIFLLYSELLSDPKGQLEKVASFLNVKCIGDKVEGYCRKFVEQNLRRNVVVDTGDDLFSSEFPEALTFFRKQIKLASKDSFSRDDAASALKVWKQSSPMQNHFLKPIIPLLSDVVSQRLVLNQQMSSLRKEFDQVNSDKRKSKMALDEATSDRELIKAEFEEVISDRERIKAEFEEITSDRDHIRIELKEVSSSRDALQAEFADVASERDHIRIELKEVSSSRDAIQAELAEVASDRDQTRTELNDVSSSRDAIQAELAEVASDRDQISTELNDVSSSRDAIQAELAEVASDRDQIRTELNDVSSSRNALQTELAGVISEREQLREKLNSVISDSERMRIELEAAYQEQVKHRMDGENTITAMKRTLSWRITGPLRFIRNIQIKTVTLLNNSLFRVQNKDNK